MWTGQGQVNVGLMLRKLSWFLFGKYISKKNIYIYTDICIYIHASECYVRVHNCRRAKETRVVYAMFHQFSHSKYHSMNLQIMPCKPEIVHVVFTETLGHKHPPKTNMEHENTPKRKRRNIDPNHQFLASKS